MTGQNMRTDSIKYNTGNPGRKSISRKYVDRKQGPDS